METEIVVYIGCSLTYATETFKKGIEDFKIRLRSIPGIKVLDFIGLENGTATDVYEHDIHACVKTADLIIAECSYPSTGLGWEMGTAVEKHRKHVLAVAQKDAKVTRLVLGAECKKNPKYFFMRYTSFDELFLFVREKLEQLKTSKSSGYLNASI